MDLATIMQWVTAALAVIALLGHAKSFFGSGSKENAEAIKTLKRAVEDHERRVQSIEDEMKHLPDRDTAHRLELSMTTLNGRLDTLDERLKPIDAISQRLQEFLLERAK